MAKHVSIPYVSKQVEDLLLWRSQKDSALVLGGATVAIVCYMCNPFKPATLLCYAVALASLVTFLWAQVATFAKLTGPPVPGILARGVSEEDLRRVTEAARPAVNKALAVVGVLASGKDLRLSVLVTFCSAVAGYIFGRVGPVLLAYIVVLLAFTLPKAYDMKYDELHKLLKVLTDKAAELGAQFNETVLSKIPKASPPKKAQ